MILRSMTQHVKDQNWFAIGLDFFIVVFGVFIGIQVSNWNDTINDRQREQVVLLAMLEDIDATSRDVGELLDINIAGDESLKTLANYIDGHTSAMPLEEIDRHVFLGFYQYPSFRLTLATYEELKNTGNLDLVVDKNLRKRLQLLEGAIGSARSDSIQLEQLTLNVTDNYLLENYDLRGIVGQRAGENPTYLEWVDPTKNRADISGIFDDPLFMNLVLHRARLNGAYQRDAKRLLTELAEIGDLIKTKLGIEGPNP